MDINTVYYIEMGKCHGVVISVEFHAIFFRTKVKFKGLQSRNTVEVSSMQTKCSIQNDFQRMNIQILHLSWFHISCNGTQNN